MVTVSTEHSNPILLISSLILLSLLRVSWTRGNLSLNFSFNSFFISEGLTYSITLVCKSDHVVNFLVTIISEL